MSIRDTSDSDIRYTSQGDRRITSQGEGPPPTPSIPGAALGAAPGLQLALLESPTGRTLADFSPVVTGLVITDGPHGRESLVSDIDQTIRQAARWYQERRVLYTRLAYGPEVVWDGRLEDKRITDDGLGITSLGYWRAMFDLPYTAMWSYTGVAAWRPVSSDDDANYVPERFELDNNNRLYMAAREDETYVDNVRGAWTLETPTGENSGQRSFIAIDFDYYLYAPADWDAFLLTGDRDDFNGAARWTLTSSGTPELGTVSITFSATPAERLVFGFDYGNAIPGPFASPTGEAFLRITNLRVATVTTNRVDTLLGGSVLVGANTVTPNSMANIYAGQKLRIDQGTSVGETVTVTAVTATTFNATFAHAHSSAGTVEAIVLYPHEIAADLLAFVGGVNATQLSSSTAGIEEHDRDLLDEWYEDVLPADILTYLAARGDLSGNVWEVGVRDDRRLYFRPKGTYAQTWYVDVTAIALEQSNEALFNSAYGLYQDVNGLSQRTKNNTDVLSVARHGLTRRAAVPAYTTADEQAVYQRDAFLADSSVPSPRLALTFRHLWTAGGALVRHKWRVKAGDTLVLRNVDPTLLSGDELLSFGIGRVWYDVDGDNLTVEPEGIGPSFAAMMARVMAFTEPRGGNATTPRGGGDTLPHGGGPSDPRG